MYNTLEIRLHQGTVNKEEIQNWIDLWSYLLKVVTRRYEKFKNDGDVLESARKAHVPHSVIEFYKQKRLEYSNG